MKLIKAFAVIGALSMTIVLLNGFINGSFFEDGAALFDNPWGIVSFVDLYVGFVLFSLWIAYRESHVAHSAIWIFFMMTLGFFTASIYVLYASFQSKNNIKKLLLGKHYSKDAINA